MDLKGVLIFILTLSVSALVFSIFKDLLHKNIVLLGYYVAAAFIATYIILKLIFGAKDSASSRFRRKRPDTDVHGQKDKGFETIAEDVLSYSPLEDKSKKEKKGHRWGHRKEKKEEPKSQPKETTAEDTSLELDLFGESSDEAAKPSGQENEQESGILDLGLDNSESAGEEDVVFCPNGDIVERKDLVKKDGKLYCPVCGAEIT